MKAAIYCRVSTADQTTENQKLAIQRFCELQNIKIFQTYEDTISGSKQNREGLNQLKQDIGKYDSVIVWKLDRLARSTIHLLQTLNFFTRHSVGFISVTENVDTTTPAGKMLVTFLGAIAEFEREIIRERVIAGLERAKENNVKLGRPRKGFDVSEAIKLRNEGRGFGEIAALIGESKSTVYRALKAVSKTPTESV